MSVQAQPAPDATSEAPATPPNPAFHKPPAAPGEGRQQQQQVEQAQQAPPPTVPLTVDEYNRLRGLESQFNQFQRERQAELEAKEAERIQALAEAGQIKEALEAQKTQWAEKEAAATHKYKELETQVFSEAINAALHEAMLGKQFVNDHAAQAFKRLHRDEIEARREADGSIKVYEKGGHRPAAEWLSERLSDESLAYLFAPTTRGGSGSDGARHPAPPQQEPQPGSVDAVAKQWKANQKPGFGLHRPSPDKQ